MKPNADFSIKFRLVLKALSVSRGRMAADVGVDKSLVGRWASGAVRPSEHNLSKITALIAKRVPNFTMLDWERDLARFAELCGVDLVAEPVAGGQFPSNLLGLPLSFFEQCRHATERRGKAYEGFWRTTRPSVIMTGKVFHDRGMIRLNESGFLEVRMGGAGLLFEGFMLPAEGNLFVILYDAVGFTPLFLVFRGVPLPKADVLDGLLLLASLNADRTPAAVPIVLERIGDLTGDPLLDEAKCQELLVQEPIAQDGEESETILRHLMRDFGPQAAAAGGDLFLKASASLNLSKGMTTTGQLRG